jgi:hypothetical protein
LGHTQLQLELVEQLKLLNQERVELILHLQQSHQQVVVLVMVVMHHQSLLPKLVTEVLVVVETMVVALQKVVVILPLQIHLKVMQVVSEHVMLLIL